MRILIVPLPALAATNGSQSRVSQLIKGFSKEGFEVATCAAIDYNYKEREGVSNYYLEVPIPMGFPKIIGKNLFQIANRLGVTKRKAVHSFEEVLFLTGALSEKYFKKNIQCVSEAILQYKPDCVYSEFNLGTIVAAKLAGVKCVTNYSFPVQAQYAASPQYAKGVNRVLRRLGLKEVHSSLELFDLADYKVVPSSPSLEPIEGEKVIFTGPFVSHTCRPVALKKNKIVAYMGSGTISNKQLVKELTRAFVRQDVEVYIAGSDLKEKVEGNIHMGRYFDFEALLPETLVFIHHGGQNSVMQALRYGVPQLICPGKVFERQYNASSIEKRKAGIVVNEKVFTSQVITRAVEKLVSDPCYRENSMILWGEIEKLGGIETVTTLMKRIKKEDES